VKRVDISHPAITEMISRRSDGDPNYVAGVRAFLAETGKPTEGTIAYKGYLDAHDMTAYLSGVLADLRADEWVEESLVFARRFVGRENIRPAPRTPVERPQVAQEIKVEQRRSMRV
jgi:hypothetical protein